MKRHQLPARSPLSFGALAAGATGLFGLRNGERHRVEALLARRFGAVRVLLVDSGTTALGLAITAARRPDDRPVAVPAYACYDVGTAVQAAGAEALLYDLDPGNLGPDPASLERALREGAGSVVVVHLFGFPVDLDRIHALAGAHSATVIEDAAQGSGALYRGLPVGSRGPFSVLSFGRGKGLVGGGGGALLATEASSAAALDDLRSAVAPAAGGLSDLLAASAQWMLGRPAAYGVPASIPWLGLGETTYREPRPARWASRSSVSILGRGWSEVAREEEVRKRNAARLLASLRPGDPLAPPEPTEGADPGYLRLPVVPPAGRRVRVGPEAERLGVRRGYPRPLHHLSVLRPALRNANERFPGAERLAEALLTLPTHGLLAESDLRRLEEWLEAMA